MKKTHTIMHKRTILLLFSLLVLFVSCEDDWFYEDRLVDYEWEVDLFQLAPNSERLISYFNFSRDQRGSEIIRCSRDGAPFKMDYFNWSWDRYDRKLLILEYNYDVRFIRILNMNSRTFDGLFYWNEDDVNLDDGIHVYFNRVYY